MIVYSYSTVLLTLFVACAAFGLGYLLGVTEKKINRNSDYWRGYTDCMNETKETPEQ